MKDANITWRAGNRVELTAGGLFLVLDSTYALRSKEEDSSVSILFFRPGTVNGYYLGSLQCEQTDHQFNCYVPRNLFVELEGKKVAEIISNLPNDLLKCYEPIDEADELEYRELQRQLNLQGGAPYRNSILEKMRKKIRAPNPGLMSYREFRVWVRGPRRAITFA